nr:WbqC family protein [uncultured Pedobacter sp.]
MKLAIMQPYIFPYIGYFQLINAVDKFIVYDDVNFINKGWVNRNRILINKKPNLFTIPLKDASQNKLINQIELINNDKWKIKLIKTIDLAYKKAPYFSSVVPLIIKILESEKENISRLALNSLKEIASYLNIETKFVDSSSIYANQNLSGQDRILDICLKEDANHYINPTGGTDLYNREDFESSQMTINFIKSLEINYRQFDNDFVSGLSIIDVMMFNNPQKIKEFLKKYQLV